MDDLKVKTPEEALAAINAALKNVYGVIPSRGPHVLFEIELQQIADWCDEIVSKYGEDEAANIFKDIIEKEEEAKRE